ncbi:hypothetical protein EDB83DRAFT_366895 [Lactarius deliciosus]|nr:hypothetical protein EDB83DRAFT_366895 [Lactarius deliciosus]
MRPLSQTDKAPSTGTTTEMPEEPDRRLPCVGSWSQSTVVLFMRGSPDVPRCGVSRKICELLRDEKIEFSLKSSVQRGVVGPVALLFSSMVEELTSSDVDGCQRSFSTGLRRGSSSRENLSVA